MIIGVNKKSIIMILILIIFVFGCFIWYGELGTNKKIPKKAILVNDILLENDIYG